MTPVAGVVVTGLSGAGRTTALRALEDLGYTCVDNLPVPLIERFAELAADHASWRRVAMGVDAREGELLDRWREVAARVRAAGHALRVLYLEASDPVLVRRFSETRRRHPLAESDLRAGIAREREMLAALRDDAEIVLDTSEMTVHDLRHAVQDAFGAGTDRMAVSLVSFGYRFGLPAEADLVFDVRLLRNPHFVDELRPLPGTDERVRRFVLDQPEAAELIGRAGRLLDFLLPGYRREGKAYLTVAVGCTGGQHRSVAIAEALASRLPPDYSVTVRHRDLGRK